jgi:S-adenosylmethionine synthetase
MIRMSEMVLPGHPDKFCDQVADEVIAECVRADPDAYGQVEVSAWSDQVWLSGGICTRAPLAVSLEEIVHRTGVAIGYTGGNWMDAERYRVTSTVCQQNGDPLAWTAKVNDQSILVGWAGYDAKTRYLPPEHFLAHAFRERLTDSCRDGGLCGHGPDGKLLIVVREEQDRWTLEHVLATLQQLPEVSFLDVCEGITSTIEESYRRCRELDPRWCADWSEVRLAVNPNGPLLNGGSDGDNGQTGRKLVMDFYGPRVPIGGGALSGKHLSHIDRVGAYAAREAAVRAVASGASECLVRVAYAPGIPEPMDVSYEMYGRGERMPTGFFDHGAMRQRYGTALDYTALARGGHFFDEGLPWNTAARGDKPGRRDAFLRDNRPS